jgi:hypothetical protein
MHRPPIAISYVPKPRDYLPVVVASIRANLGDWPIVLMTQEANLPPRDWLAHHAVEPLTDWSHSDGANKIKRLWEHQEIFAAHMDAWIWWHDDMALLRPLEDPVAVFEAPLVRHRQRKRPNEELGNWENWLWETLSFFRCQSVYAPNPVLHIPRVIRKSALADIPANWNRKRLLFEPTYLLWTWHHTGVEPVVARGFRKSVFTGELPDLAGLADEGYTILNWGKRIDHDSAQRQFERRFGASLTFSQAPT